MLRWNWLGEADVIWVAAEGTEEEASCCSKINRGLVYNNIVRLIERQMERQWTLLDVQTQTIVQVESWLANGAHINF